MSVEPKALIAEEVLKRCEESEVARREGGASFDPKSFIGRQDRFVHALEMCINSDDQNMLAVDLNTRPFEIVETRLKASLAKRKNPEPQDVAYVYNFEDARRPIPITLPKKGARTLKVYVSNLLADLKKEVSSEIGVKAVKQKEELHAEFLAWQKEMKGKVDEYCRSKGFEFSPTGDSMPLLWIIRTITGQPPSDGEGERDLADNDHYEQLTPAQKTTLRLKEEEFQNAFKKWFQENNFQRTTFEKSKEFQLKVEAVDMTIAQEAIKKVFKNYDKLPPAFGQKLLEHSLERYPIFFKAKKEKSEDSQWEMQQDNPFLPFAINVFVDHSETEGVPIVATRITNLQAAIGTINRRPINPFMSVTDHTGLMHGVMHEANGGYLVLYARDFATVPGLALCIKHMLLTGEIAVGETPFFIQDTLHPEPMDANVKVILVGPAWLMQLISTADDEYANLFDIRGEVLTKVERTSEEVRSYSEYFRAFTEENGMQSLADSGASALIEHMQRLADDQGSLSTDFSKPEKILREANALCKDSNRSIKRADIEKAIRDCKWLSSVRVQRRHEMIKNGSLIISTTGEKVGQINGLVVTGFDQAGNEVVRGAEIESFCRSAAPPFNLPAEYAKKLALQFAEHGMSRAAITYGHSARITARASVGKFAVVNLLKEVDQAGSLFQKADLTVQEVLRGIYGLDEPLVAHIAFSFEQNYGGVDGDSASLAQLFLIESVVGKLPLRQDLAITGSLSQLFEVQPIGGLNDKTEGWHDDCVANGGLSGQGVIIPHLNAKNLMLREDVVKAVAAGVFHVYSISTLDEGRKLLFNRDPAEVRAAVKRGFEELAEKAKKFNASTKSD